MDSGNCSAQAISDFSDHIDGQLIRVNALLAASTILIGVLVGIGAYGQRYRHHPLTSFLFLGANTLFLPILSYVVSSIGTQDFVAVFSDPYIIPGRCHTQRHIMLVFIWASLVLIAGVNTTAIVAGDDKKGRNNYPPAMALLVQALWTSYLAVEFLGKVFFSTRHWSLEWFDSGLWLIFLSPFALLVAKLAVKYYAWYMARGSLAFGRNPHLIVGYMEQLKAELPASEQQHSLPPLIVTGEDTALVHKEPHGYSLTRIDDNNGLVTLDKVWQLGDGTFLRNSTKQLKDVCLSFGLFKLLRCRFARHATADTCFLKAHVLLLQEGDDERAFGVIADELSFIHGYYYSPFPISYSRSWLPGLNILISLLSMSLSLFYMDNYMIRHGWGHGIYHYQIRCAPSCDSLANIHHHSHYPMKDYGNFHLDDAPLLLVAALVALAEVREVASYICSNWPKVALVCNYVRHASRWKRLFGLVLHCQCKLLNHWEDKMNQCSLLALNPSTTPVALLRRLIPLLDTKKVPRAVKAAVLKSLRCPNWSPSNGVASLCTRLHLQADNNPLSASSGVKGIADTMLVAHIATTIMEVRRSEAPRQSDSAHEVAATHLSRYCAYLVAYVPELLPDDDLWCKSLYKAVQKKGKRALAAAGGARVAASNPQALVQALNAGSEEAHYVLENGAELGKKLVELAAEEGEGAAWEALADFWSEMILYAAPSDNVDAHAEAIARGGELITLLWALLTHLGVVSRPEAATPDAPGDV